MKDGQNEVKYLVGFAGETAYLSIFGKANYLNCRKIGDFFSRVIAKGCKAIKVDCSSCTGMDSTFLGTLAGAALKMRKIGGSFEIDNLVGRNLEIVDNLGLGKIVKINSGASDSSKSGSDALETEAADAIGILDAHKNLVAADSSNFEKFENVISFLERDASGGE